MSRASFALLLVCFVCLTELSCGYIIRGRNFDSVFTKEVPASQDLIDGNKLSLDPEVFAPEIPLNKKCKAIGEFCMNHKDCCTNACLGYLKKCVSG
nr:uncharacterized protein LOC113393036 [Vanessa tameamea]